MKTDSEKKIVFFGCPLDCDEKHDSIQEKLQETAVLDGWDDPYKAVIDLLPDQGFESRWSEAGSIEVPGWLRPRPAGKDLEQIVVDEFVKFMDSDGCRKYANRVHEKVLEILPDIPCMIAVDHSLTGGAFSALADYFGKDDVTVIVLDTHTDAISMPVMAEAIHYDIDTNPSSPFSRDDPFLYDRTDSYNASTFVHHLIDEGILFPGNVFILGVGDYPDKRTFRIKDKRVQRYTRVFSELKKKGVTLVTKKDCTTSPAKLKALLKKVQTPKVYISIDMDVGAGNALDGVRFRERQGLSEKQMLRLVDTVMESVSDESELAGFDLTEFNPRRTGKLSRYPEDRTYEIAVRIISRLGFGKDAAL